MRLDVYLVEFLGVENRSKARNLIDMGRVTVDGKPAEKCGIIVDNKKVELLKDMEYPSMGGYKLKKALEDFGLNINGFIAADVGSANGGFTSVLLEKGAAKVYAVDIGECAFDDALKCDPRVIIKDRTNAKELSSELIGEAVDIVTVDLSFISLKTVLVAIRSTLKESGVILALVKPQFEAGAKCLNKKGIVTDKKARESALKSVIEFAESIGLKLEKCTTAPIIAGKNIEYLAFFSKRKADFMN